MVQIASKINRKLGYVDDGSPQPLYSRFHRNTFQRDLIDLGYYVDVESHEPVLAGYDWTEGNYAPDALPQPSDDIDTLRADLLTHGYCLVAEALNPAQLATFRERIDAQAKGEREARVASYNSADAKGVPTNQFLLTLVNKGRCFADAIEMAERSVAKGALLDQLLAEMLGSRFICNSAAAAIAGPNGSPQALHCGQSMIPKPWPPWPFECFCGFLIDDFDFTNGGTLVIPGSHQILTDAGTAPLASLPKTTNVVAPAGTALIMDGRLVHGTGTNRSDALRRLLILTFHKPFVRQQEQWPLSVRSEIYETASPKLLERLGFQAWHGGLGGYEGSGDGGVAPLRDGYVAIGELPAAAEETSKFTVRARRAESNQKTLEAMREQGHLLAGRTD